MDPVRVRTASSSDDVAVVASLFREYQHALVAVEGPAAEAHICFQDFDDELARLGTMYGAPDGTLLLAEDAHGVVGCVGVRAAGEPGAAEMKRLYLRPRARGTGSGRRLALASMEAARALGYKRMVLDTLPTMKVAIALYRSLGFTTRAAYYEGAPVATIYFERAL